MKSKLELELDFTTDLSEAELALRIALIVQEAVERVKQSIGSNVELNVSLVLDGREVRLVMKTV